MQPVIQNAPKKSFVRSAFLLMGGTIFCQALTIVASPMLTRIFDASAYGTAGLISTAAGSMSWAAGPVLPLRCILLASLEGFHFTAEQALEKRKDGRRLGGELGRGKKKQKHRE